LMSTSASKSTKATSLFEFSTRYCIYPLHCLDS
jgi:hypothetical protein